ncbi:MAG: MBOAT family protein [Synergistaceae bacterium]|nr:MBOAT family protein [Synergistaceae bacterium]
MLFSTYEFIFVFLPVTLAGYFALSKQGRNFPALWLLASSFMFYGINDAKSLPILITSICANYFVGRKIESGVAKKFWLISGLSFDFILLCFFKVTAYLPLGVSFFTFTQSAYLINTYRGSAKIESLTKYAGYVSFFPHVISGPISDYRDIMPQLNDGSKLIPNWDNIAAGITLFILGLFKKVCVADILAPIVDQLFANMEALTFVEAWFAALGYGMQLYFDFSAYSDMAIGVALMFNIKLPQNFDSPYKSLSIIDFWRRWHITLGAWVRDYIYIPMGGSREGDLKRTRNVITAMLFTGLWHGLGWTFVLWGLLHGLMLAVNHQWRRLGMRLPVILSWGLTFACVILCWAVFRAENLNEAGKILSAMLDIRHIVLPVRLSKYLGFLEAYGLSFRELASGGRSATLLASVVALLLPNTRQIMERFRPNALWAVAMSVIAVTAFLNFSGVSDFLYFQF